MKTKVLFTVLLIATIFISCKKNNDEPETTSITPVEIAKNHFMNNHVGPSNLVIYNQTEWNDFLTQIENSINVNYVFGQANIDFQNEMVIAVIDSVYPTGGWSVDITNITENPNDIEVLYTNLETGDDTMIIIEPFHVVKIPRSNKPFVFTKY